MESSSSPNKAVIAIIIIALLAVAAAATIILTNNKSSNSDTTVSTATDLPTTITQTNKQDGTSNAALRNGTYSATGNYQTPGGMEAIEVKVTLTDGIVTDATITKQGKTGEAQEFQSAFVSGFKSQVVGKKVSEVKLDRVAGSSLTPNGFNNALDDIEKQAQA